MYDMELNWAGRPPSNAPEMFMAHNRPWTTDVDPGVTEERVNQSETYWTGDIEKNKNTTKQNLSRTKCSNSALPSPKKDRQGLAKRSSSYENVKIFIWKYDDHQIMISHMMIKLAQYDDHHVRTGRRWTRKSWCAIFPRKGLWAMGGKDNGPLLDRDASNCKKMQKIAAKYPKI